MPQSCFIENQCLNGYYYFTKCVDWLKQVCQEAGFLFKGLNRYNKLAFARAFARDTIDFLHPIYLRTKIQRFRLESLTNILSHS